MASGASPTARAALRAAPAARSRRPQRVRASSERVAGTSTQASQVNGSWPRDDGAEDRHVASQGMSRRGSITTPGRIVGAGDADTRLSATKRTRPAKATLKPRPTMISLAPSRVTMSDMASPITPPARTAASSASSQLPSPPRPGPPTSAPASIIDSSPRLTRPPMRLTKPPIAASSTGVVISSAAWTRSIIVGLRAPPTRKLRDGEDHHRALQDLDDLDRNVAEKLDVRAGR